MDRTEFSLAEVPPSRVISCGRVSSYDRNELEICCYAYAYCASLAIL